MAKKEDFVHLHLHSDHSALDGCGKVGEFVETAAKRGSPAIAFTEHGTMRGFHTTHVACEKQGIKAIHGIEFYVSKDMHRKGLTVEEKNAITDGLKHHEKKTAIREYEAREGIRDRWHITAWAQNDVGLKNLYKLSTESYIDGFYYKPRIDIKRLMELNEGIMVATGCMSSVVNDHIVSGKRKEALNTAERLRDCFGERLFIEMQPHDMPEQVAVNKFALELKKRWGKHARLLATQDAHYVKESDAEHHEVLLCIGTNDKMSNPDRFRFSNRDFYFKTRKEMKQSFKRHHSYMKNIHIKESLDSTLVLAEQANAKLDIDYHAALLPHVDLPEGHVNEWEYLKSLCSHGLTWRDIPKRAEAVAKEQGVPYSEMLETYSKRLKYEMRVLKKQGFVSYFLIVHDLYAWARSQNIMCGPGRGSVAGSLVSFLLGLTSVDPIEHGLIFERFINPDRVDAPDIDMDFMDVRRYEVFEYLRQKYGVDRVAQIATVGKLSGKQCLKDTARVLDVPYIAVNEVTNSIIERSSGDERASQTIEDSFKDFKVCRDFDQKYPDVLRHSKRLEGMAKNLGIHAAGVVVAPEPLINYLPLETRKHDGKDLVVTACDMGGVSALGLVKLDVLGLRTLTVIRDALDAIEANYGKCIDMEADVPLNDKGALKIFTDHDYVGIFQYDTPGADKICAGVKFKKFEDVAAMTALNRPGTARSGLASQYVARKKNPKLIKKSAYHPLVSEITSDTLGIIVYQEHVIKIFTEIAGFAPGTADSLRKSIAKKHGDETIGKERENFINGAMERTGMTQEQAAKIISAITFFGCLAKGTEILTPDGIGNVEDLKGGDSIFSLAGNGVLALNQIKSVGRSGVKAVVKVETTRGAAVCTLDHYWKTKSGRYLQTRDLKPGQELDFPNNFSWKGNADGKTETAVLRGKMFEQNFGPRLMRRSLSKGLQSEKDGPRESSEFRTQQIGDGAGQRVEKGVDENPPSGQSSSRGDQWREQSRLERRSYQRFPQGQDGIDEGTDGLSTVRRKAESKPPSAEYESVAPSSQGQGQTEQSAGESGIALPTVSFNRAHEREISGRFPRVISIRPVGKVETWDIECEFEPHNYVLANGLTSHNSYGFNKSHATSYGMIAYWGAWLKKYYQREFYWALLKNEPQRIRVQSIARDAKNHGIRLLAPDVSTSGEDFTIDVESNAIRGSLVDIKGVGAKAAQSIMENQPYDSFWDFYERVDRRKCHKGVVMALAKAGALDNMLYNVKWFIANLETIWEMLGKKSTTSSQLTSLRTIFKKSAKYPDYPKEERQLIASSVNPLAFGRHPIDAYEDFISRSVHIPLVSMSEDSFFKDNNNKCVYVYGVIVEVKYNQIGDFHTGEAPSEAEKKRMRWGARYSNVNVEDGGGVQNRIKFDTDIFDEMRPIIDAGIGTPVIVHASVNAKFQNLRANFAIDLEVYRKKIDSGDELNIWENIIQGHHPIVDHKWKNDEIREKRTKNEIVDAKMRDRGLYCGLVTHVQLKYDKNGNEMAFFGILGANEHIEAICFASQWDRYYKRTIKMGSLIIIGVEKQSDRWRGVSYVCVGGEKSLRLMKK
jgi:DNA-directed DNA polymerase III PolC